VELDVEAVAWDDKLLWLIQPSSMSKSSSNGSQTLLSFLGNLSENTNVLLAQLALDVDCNTTNASQNII